jgi:methylmalonyl-CoA mutase
MDLFDDFEGVSYNDWKEKITADLKGKDYNQNLVWNTDEQISVQPIYNSETLEDNISSSYQLNNNKSDWEIREQISLNNISLANKHALTALKGGANSLQFNGSIDSLEDLNNLLNEIMLNVIQVHFYTPAPSHTETLFTEYAQQENYNSEELSVSFAFDYLGELLQSGNWNNTEESDKASITSSPHIVVNGANFTNAGATSSQELASILSQAVEYINLLTNNGVAAQNAINKIQFNVGINSNYFFEIAKVRALKILWQLVTKEYGFESTPYIHATTTTYNIAAPDAQTNILRATTEAMSAIIAGCNSLSVTPFNIAYESANDFTNRVARNIQIILKEESYFDKVKEPSKGSYYIEELTDQLVQQALKLFQSFENKGGFLSIIKDGSLQNLINEAHDKKLNDFVTNQKTLLGVNKHPNKMEATPTTISSTKQNTATILTPLSQKNLAQEIMNTQTVESTN